jgi:hypothetical protein
MEPTRVMKGLIRTIPGMDYVLYKFLRSQAGGGETQNARYCYAVWMRHLILAWQKGLNKLPGKVIEFGPGQSLGVGILASLLGIEQYIALDSIKFSKLEHNLKIFEDLCNLLAQRAAVPNNEEFPRLKPRLDDYSFPFHIFSEKQLDVALSENKLAEIRNAINNINNSQSEKKQIIYEAPWHDTTVVETNSVDMIMSQSVLQYMDDLDKTYHLMHKWLKPGGLISHQIDLKSLGSADTWYGHWEYSDMEWRIVKGRKNYHINRSACSTHLDLLKKYNFKIITCIKETSNVRIDRSRLAPRFKNLTDEDISTSSIFYQAIKV